VGLVGEATAYPVALFHVGGTGVDHARESALRSTLYALRSTLYALRSTLYALRSTSL